MKSLVISLVASSALFSAQLANPDEFSSHKSFSPPKPITPNVAQSYGVENQFDRTDRSDYFSVAKKIDGAMRPLKFSSGFYGRNFYNSLLGAYRGSNYYGMLNLNHTKANGYKDGGGDEVDFGYERFNQAAVLGFVPNDLSEFKFTFLHDNIKDDKQPEYQMDPIRTDRRIFKFDARAGEEDLSNTLNLGFTYKRIEREANNFNLRKANSDAMAFVKLDRDIWDISLKYDVDFGAFHNLIGASYEHDDHSGKRYKHTKKMDFVNSYRFADVEIDKYRIFDTLSYKFNKLHEVALGLNYEFNDAELAKYNLRALNPQNKILGFASARDIWAQIYGREFSGNIKKEAFSAEFKYEFTPTELQKYALNIAHTERIGNNQERFHSLSNWLYNSTMKKFMTPGGVSANVISGNPFLQPEEHNFIKFSADTKSQGYKGYLNSVSSGWNVGGSVMFDDVKNLIVYDRIHGKTTLPGTPGSIIYTKNADARIFLTKLFTSYNFTPNFAASGKFFYAYGQNRDDSKPLYQVRPIEFDLNLDYKDYFSQGSFNLGTGVRAVGKQTRGDFDKKTGFGIDNEGAAKGFALFDLYAGINFKDKFGVKFGVNNVFDKKYSEFISADHVEALAPSLVYAPGRTFWLSFNAAF